MPLPGHQDNNPAWQEMNKDMRPPFILTIYSGAHSTSRWPERPTVLQKLYSGPRVGATSLSFPNPSPIYLCVP